MKAIPSRVTLGGSPMSQQQLAPAQSDALRPVYRNATLWVLMLTGALSFLDRQVMNILAESIKLDLNLSDTDIGLLTGLAFALFYAVLGIPLAHFADRPTTDRAKLISVALIVWSGMTAMCGMAQTFTQLLLARLGVGAGEAGATPPAHSLIGESFPARQRPAALAFYGLGLPLGTLVGMTLGGHFADQFGWRAAFLLLGVPGAVFGFVLLFLLRDPRKRSPALVAFAAKPVAEPRSSLGQLDLTLWRSPSLMFLLGAISLASFYSYGKNVWQAVFFIRIHGLTTAQAGLAFGLMSALSTMLGATGPGRHRAAR